MARGLDDFAQNPDGSIVLKTYKIPFRPEYVLVEGPSPDGYSLPNYVSIAQPLGRDIRGFRFHLAPEAVKLLMAQDPHVTENMGFSKLMIVFDAMSPDFAMIEVTRGVRVKELQPST